MKHFMCTGSLIAFSALVASVSDARAQTFPSTAGSGTCRVVFAATTATFLDCNVFVQNGAGSTASTNGKGNLIIGYNEDTAPPNTRSGSHNLVVGPEHTYSNYGGVVAGLANSITGAYASVSGGTVGIASGASSSVAGGWLNTASAASSSVNGGVLNIASGSGGSVSGGSLNEASGPYAAVTGGAYNVASGDWSSVSGGHINYATADYASVSGGKPSARE